METAKTTPENRSVTSYRFGDFDDTERFELRRGGQPVPLEPQVFELLVYLELLAEGPQVPGQPSSQARAYSCAGGRSPIGPLLPRRMNR